MPSLVSVVIPSYNHGRFIARALRCLLEQSYSHWEAIVVDNHSTDDTSSVLEQFADPRIRVEKIDNQGVIAASRNRGIRAARGEWVAFLDSDDWWTSNKLERCLKDESRADFIYHGMRIVRDGNALPSRDTIRSRALQQPVWLDLLLDGNPIANSSVLVRRALLERIHFLREDRDMIAAEDFNAWIRIARLTDRFTYLPDELGFYLEHGSSMSQRDMSGVHAMATAEFVADMTLSQRRRRDAQIAYIHGRYCFLSRDDARAREALRLSLLHGSWALRVKSAYMLLRLIAPFGVAA